jgi:hypothetical protein
MHELYAPVSCGEDGLKLLERSGVDKLTPRGRQHPEVCRMWMCCSTGCYFMLLHRVRRNLNRLESRLGQFLANIKLVVRRVPTRNVGHGHRLEFMT